MRSKTQTIRILLLLLFVIPNVKLIAQNSVEKRTTATVGIPAGILTKAQYNSFFPYRNGVKDVNGSWVLDTKDDFYTYESFLQAVSNLANIKTESKRRCGTNAMVLTRIDKTTGTRLEVRHDPDFDTDFNKNKEIKIETVDYANFLNVGSPEMIKRELAAFFANISHETTGGWPTAPGGQHAWGLHFVYEGGIVAGMPGYEQADAQYPPVSGKRYSGRGPIQISWNYNYGQASEIIYGNKNILLNNPEKVGLDAVLAFETAIWFWMAPQYPKPSCHDIMTGGWLPNDYDLSKKRYPGLGMTVNIVNGGLECGNGGTEKAQVLDRIGFYKRFAGIYAIGLDMSGNNDESKCGCKDMIDYRADNLSLESCNNPVVPPDIGEIAPVNGTSFLQNSFAPITFSATITDDYTVSSVFFTINGIKYTAVKNSNKYTYVWTPSSYGTISLLITATDNQNGNSFVTNSYSLSKENNLNCATIVSWNATQIYSVANTLVVYGNKIYKNAWYTSGTPGIDTAWVLIQSCVAEPLYCGYKSWLNSKVYYANDIVYYGNNLYKAKWYITNEIPSTSAAWQFESSCTQTVLNNQNEIVNYSFYPSPVVNIAYLDVYLEEIQPLQITVFDLFGKKVFTANQINSNIGKNSIALDLSKLAPDVYVYELLLNNKKITGKFLKTHY